MSKGVRVIATAFGVAVAAYLFARLLAHADARATWRAIGYGGPFVALALAPFAVGMTLDAYGTVVLLRALGSRTTLTQMLPVRIASEALHLSIPAGFVASDTATAMLLEARSDVPVRDGVVTSIARKWLVMRAHAAYIALGALAGFPALASVSRGLVSGRALPWAVLASAAVPLGASWALGAGLLGRSTFAKLHAALARVASGRLGHWLEARRSEAIATDAQVARLRAARPATTVATLAFFACWCVEALESALLLRLVGAQIALPSVLAIEAGLSIVRSLAVALPSGLGVVDIGYAAVLPLLGADAASAAAFVLLKRAKELLWVGAGYGILGAMRGRVGPCAASAPPLRGLSSAASLRPSRGL
jgi:glycosyltransferase 2 family protein